MNLSNLFPTAEGVVSPFIQFTVKMSMLLRAEKQVLLILDCLNWISSWQIAKTLRHLCKIGIYGPLEEDKERSVPDIRNGRNIFQSNQKRAETLLILSKQFHSIKDASASPIRNT